MKVEAEAAAVAIAGNLAGSYPEPAERMLQRVMAQSANAALASGSAREMIIVVPDALTIFEGSMYSTSVTTGDFEGFIVRDLVEHIDSHYRTIPERASRGAVPPARNPGSPECSDG